MGGNFDIGPYLLVLPAVAAFFCFASAIALVSLIRLNKGAKINIAWGLLAFGLTCFGLAALDRTLELLGLPSAAQARDALMAFAALIAAIGVFYGHALYRNLTK